MDIETISSEVKGTLDKALEQIIQVVENKFKEKDEQIKQLTDNVSLLQEKDEEIKQLTDKVSLLQEKLEALEKRFDENAQQKEGEVI